MRGIQLSKYVSIVLLLFVFNANAAETGSNNSTTKKTPLQYWQETGLGPSELFNGINSKACRANELSVRACLMALDAFAAGSQPIRRFVPKSWLAAQPDLQATVEKDFGTMVLVQVKSTETPTQKKSVREIMLKMKEERDKLNAALLASGRSNFDFDNARDTIVKLTSVKAQESLQTASAITTYLEVFDGHAKIQPTAQLRQSVESSGDDSFAGVGMTFRQVDTKHVIEAFMDGSPADKSELRVGDTLEKVNGVSLEGMSSDGIRSLVIGPVGSKVVIEVRRDTESLRMNLVRGKIEVLNVSSSLIDDGRTKYAYVKLAGFMSKSGCSDVAKAIAMHESNGARAIIFDVRGNPGGLVDQAACLGGLFVGPKIIMKVQQMGENFMRNVVSREQQRFTRPMVILIDAGSASASEVLSGALQDHKRAWVLGERSFGKGSVQQSSDYEFATGFTPVLQTGKISIFQTIATFYQPNGRTNQLAGIIPNFEVPAKPGMTEDERYRMREAEFVPNAIQVTSTPWVETRPLEVQAIRSCLETKGVAKAKYDASATARKRLDFQILSAQDVLACELGAR